MYAHQAINGFRGARHIIQLILYADMPSRQWDYFMENFFGDPYMMWHDGIDARSVCSLEGAERDLAENMLIESMKEGSYWAPMGLREMRSEKAVPVMKEMLAWASGDMLIEIAIALNVIENTTKYYQYILHVLQQSPSPYFRLRAAMKLRDFPTPEVIEALFDAVSDVDYLVRNHASESLLAIHGLQPTISEHKQIFKLIITHPNDEEGISKKDAATAYKEAERILRTLLKK
jgi:HEAT repeat protein